MVQNKPIPIRFFPFVAFIPLWIFSAISYYYIKCLRKGALVIAGSWGIAIGLQMILPFPYGLGLSLVIAPLPIFFTLRKWGKEWNEKLKSGF